MNAIIVGQGGTGSGGGGGSSVVQISDGTHNMGTMALFGVSPGSVYSLNVNASIFQGTTVIGEANPLYVQFASAQDVVLGAGSALVGQIEISDGTNVLGTDSHPIRIDPTGTTIQPTQDVSDGTLGDAVPSTALAIGARAATTYPTATSDGDLVGVMADKAGRQVNVLNAPRNLIATISLNSSSSSLVSLIAAGATGVFNDIISFTVTNESATATIVSLSDGTVTYKFAIAANGGIVINFTTPLPATSSATAWQVLNSAAVACDFVVVYAENK